jgi:hypothetical protein
MNHKFTFKTNKRLKREVEPHPLKIPLIGRLLGQNKETDVNLRKLERLRTKLSEIDQRFVGGHL